MRDTANLSSTNLAVIVREIPRRIEKETMKVKLLRDKREQLKPWSLESRRNQSLRVSLRSWALKYWPETLTLLKS